MSFFAAVVEMPRTAPSSAMQNSATSGQPGPAMGSSCSQPGHGERCSSVDRLGRVEVGPPGRDLEELRGGLVLGGLAVTSEREQVGGREVVSDPLSHPLQRLDHVFDYTRRHRHQPSIHR